MLAATAHASPFEAMKPLTDFLYRLRDAFRDRLPIVAVIAVFQAAVLQQAPPSLTAMVAGLVIVAVGRALFIQGLEIGIFPPRRESGQPVRPQRGLAVG